MASPSYSDVINQLNTFIITNGNNEITAAVLNPVLKFMTDFANNNMGDLSLLTTDLTDDLVSAINSLKQNFDDLSNNGVQLYTGVPNPNITPPATYNYADFYMQIDSIDSSPIILWQWDGFNWIQASQFELLSNKIGVFTVDGTGQLYYNVDYINSSFKNSKSDFYIDVDGESINAGMDNFRTEFGQEYLAHYQNLVLAKSPAKIVWSGDSTTDNSDGFVSADFTLNALYGQSAKVKGVSNLTQLNNGHTGENSTNWKNTFLPLDLATNPDLYIWRWGINDPYFGISLATFESNLRSGLTTIRASKTQAQMSILLMMPNTVSDEQNGRDEKWLEQIRPIIRKAARDFQCGFIDTYSLWVDSRNGAGNLYMDLLPTTPPSSVHPKNVFNTWIISKIFDFTLPDVIINKIAVYPHSETGLILDNNLAIGGTNVDTYSIGTDHKIVTIESDASGSSRIDLVSPNSGAITFGSPAVRKAGLQNQETDIVFFNNRTNSGTTLSESLRLNQLGSLGLGTSTPSGVTGVRNFNIFESGSGNSQFIIEGNNGAQFASILSGAGPSNLPSLFFNNGFRIAIATSKDVTGYSEIGRFLSTGLRLNSLAGTQTEMVAADLDGNLIKAGIVPVSAVYTPTLVNTSNVTAATLNHAHYTRIGDVVTVTISVSANVTVGGTSAQITFNLPINRVNTTLETCGNFTGFLQSSAVYYTGIFQALTGSATDVRMYFVPLTLGANTFTGTFSYTIN